MRISEEIKEVLLHFSSFIGAKHACREIGMTDETFKNIVDTRVCSPMQYEKIKSFLLSGKKKYLKVSAEMFL